MTRRTLATWFPKRRRVSHKGTYGRVLIIAGSRTMSGAAVLTAQAALRTGSGLVHLAVPKSVHPLVVRKLTEVIVHPVAETRAGTLAMGAARVLRVLVSQSDAVAIGPGLTTHAQTVRCIRAVLRHAIVPLVIDADALNACVGHTRLLRASHAPVIVTPHPGEMARLVRQSTRAVQRARMDVSTTVAKRWNSIVILKGDRTVIALPSGRGYVNTTGNAGMATAGAGDVLTGMLVSLVGQGVTPVRASRLGVYLHGLAGDLAARRHGAASLIASDIVDTIARAIRKLRQGSIHSEL